MKKIRERIRKDKEGRKSLTKYGVRFVMAKSVINQILEGYRYVVFTNSPNLPVEVEKGFVVTNISGPIFRAVVNHELSKVIRGRMFLLGTDSSESLRSYLALSKFPVIFIRTSIENKHYMLTTFDYETVLKTDEFDPNLFDSFYFN